MLVNVFLSIVLLSITGSVGYLLLKATSSLGKKSLSQNWLYHGGLAISLLFILPFYKLWTAIPPFQGSSSAIVSALPNSSFTIGGGGQVSHVMADEVGEVGAGNIDWSLVCKWAAILWLVTAIVIVLKNFVSFQRCQSLFKDLNTEANDHLYQLALEAAKATGIRGKVRLLLSPSVQTPMLIGYLRPTIVLPLNEIPDSDAELIFAHELTHFRRKDQWKKLLLVVVQCIHWFNPVVYLLGRDYAYWMETSCDECIVSSMPHDQRKKYGYILINYAPTFQRISSKVYVSFAPSQYKLKRRIESMLNTHKNPRPLLSLMLGLVLIIGCISTTAFAAAIGDANITSDTNDTKAPSALATVALSTEDLETNVQPESSGFFSPVVMEQSTENASKYASVIPSNIVLTTTRKSKSISLASGISYKYDRRYYEAGTIIDIHATWTPTTINLRLGVYPANSDISITSVVSGGQKGIQVTIHESGYFYICVENISTIQDANVSVSYTY